MKFYIENAPAIAPEVGFVASPDETYAEDLADLEAALGGGPAEAAATPAS
jgi:hypothetical protein